MDQLVTVAAEMIAEIIGHDEQDVQPFRRVRRGTQQNAQAEN